MGYGDRKNGCSLRELEVMTCLLHVSLHDAAPLHLARLRKIQTLLRELGVDRMTCLLVPDFHYLGRSDSSPDFLAFCQQDDGISREWALHGFAHLETPGRVPAPEGMGARMYRRLVRLIMTAGEGEFFALSSEEATRRIQEGMKIFSECIGVLPEAFVAPAWLYAPNLHQLLLKLGFSVTEDHRRIYHLRTGRSHSATAITWATRSLLRQASSITCAPLIAAAQREQTLVRVAVHPSDIDHPATVASIQRILTALLRNRTCVSLKELCSL